MFMRCFNMQQKNQKNKKKRMIQTFDTTLRDGEQTPGVALTVDEKIRIAEALNQLGVDIIEAGFPIAGETEAQSVKAIAQAGLKSTVCGLARCSQKDMQVAIECEVDLVHIFIGTSPLHREYKLKMGKQEILSKAEESIQYVLDAGKPVHFSPEDACRTEYDYLLEVCKLAQDMKVDHINIPDTVGIMTPERMSKLISDLVKDGIKVPLAVHCHNDFGLAVANSVAAVVAGASIPHVTINGLGERAGNADLEQVVLGCKMLYGIEAGIVTEKMYSTSKLVERLTGIRVMPNFPIVGDNAFAHESGIHVHGVLAKKETYEVITPEMVGAHTRLVLGKHVGVHGIKAKLTELGISVDNDQLKEITSKVKDLGAKGKRVVEEDLIAIAEDVVGKVPKDKRLVHLLDLQLSTKLGVKPKAKVRLQVNGEEKTGEAEGVGPVDASLTAIREAIGDNEIRLEEYHLDAITGGSDALADVTIRVSRGTKDTMARGVDADIVMASIIAFINGLNRIIGKN
ncbi:MAG: 2-isopropylmalate synthase [Candidatus Altiarchaeota archaeon]